jgi:hypothetical protein
MLPNSKLTPSNVLRLSFSDLLSELSARKLSIDGDADDMRYRLQCFLKGKPIPPDHQPDVGSACATAGPQVGSACATAGPAPKWPGWLSLSPLFRRRANTVLKDGEYLHMMDVLVLAHHADFDPMIVLPRFDTQGGVVMKSLWEHVIDLAPDAATLRPDVRIDKVLSSLVPCRADYRSTGDSLSDMNHWVFGFAADVCSFTLPTMAIRSLSEGIHQLSSMGSLSAAGLQILSDYSESIESVKIGWRSLQQGLWNIGLVAQETPADGNCALHSILGAWKHSLSGRPLPFNSTQEGRQLLSAAWLSISEMPVWHSVWRVMEVLIRIVCLRFFLQIRNFGFEYRIWNYVLVK